MYFAIIGKNPQISLAELSILQPTFMTSTKKGIVLFDTEFPDILPTLGGCIKSGRVVPEKALQEILQDVKIIGIQEDTIGKHFKKTIGIRRFKIVKINHTDKEIKTKGKEIINLDDGKYGVVDNYQDIPLYESIDFEKPARSMQMGMMPSKLTHILINIGLGNITDKNNITIYDPFVGSGTTCFLANALGFNTIGSDINISFFEKNLIRWQGTPFYNKDNQINIFQQDITQLIQSDKFNSSNYLIVTEGRLGPIITKKSSTGDVISAQKEVLSIYQNFIHNILNTDSIGGNNKIIIFTIPYYIGHTNNLEYELQRITEKLGYNFKSIDEVYSREDQSIGRKICIIKKTSE